jgi:MFS family permease
LNYVLLNYLRLLPHRADFWMACGSTIISTIAMLAMGMAANPALLILGLLIYNLGTGFNAAMRSTAIHVVGGQSSSDIGRLMAVIAIMESIGMMIAGPLLNKIFEWAMVLGEPWLGLPYLASALVFSGMTFLMFLISIGVKESTRAEL